MKTPSKLAALCIAATALAAGAILFLSSCGKTESDKAVYTGTLISQSEISQKLGYSPMCDKYTATVYEVVDYDYLVKNYRDVFWKKMFAEDITKWDVRANCAIFSEEYVSGLQFAYYRDHFHSNSPAWRLAVGEFWYLQNPNDPKSTHSIVVAITNKGIVYLEPQIRDGSPVLALTLEHTSSRILRKI